MELDRHERERLYELDRQHVIHPGTVLRQQTERNPLLITRAYGCTVVDAEGHKYIDAVAGLWLMNVGYGRQELVEAATMQMEQLAYHQIFHGRSSVPAIKLAKRLADLTPGDLNRVLFTTGGSEANETAIKVARMFHSLQGNAGKYKIIARRSAYHGVSYGAVSATGLPSFWANVGPLNPGFVHIEPLNAQALEEAIVAEGPETVAAFIAEPVMGVGGCFVPPADYFRRVREICDRYGVLFIADEVICGFGRTGRMFGIQHWDVVPDLMTIAKGLTSGYFPLGAALISERVFQAVADAMEGSFGHGFTYGGHPTGCAVALKNLDLLLGEDLPGRSARMGTRLLELLRAKENPFIGEVRGLGLMAAVDLVRPETGEKFADADRLAFKAVELCQENGLLARALGPATVTMSPPLIITEAELERMVDVINDAILETCAALV